MIQPRILIAGIGNIFMGDDAFGVEVAQRLLRRTLPEEVRVVDFGIRGFDLTYALLGDYETVILVDAAPRGGAPGTLYMIEPEMPTETENAELIDAHRLDPVKVLRLAASMGSPIERMLLVACEPAAVNEEEMSMEMSEPVRAAVDEAVQFIEELTTKLLAHSPVV